MNKTFKVVFNKARGVMTVVNEATSSVQSKGCKAVVAAACILAASYATAEVTVTPAQGAGAYIGAEGFISTNATITAEQTETGWKVTAKDFGNESNTYGAVVNNSTNSYVNGVDVVNISADSEFANNKAKYGAGLIIFQEGTTEGEAAHAPSNNQNVIEGSAFTSNTASADGGAIAFMLNSYMGADGQTSIIDSIFSANTANNGGALYIQPTSVNITNSVFGGTAEVDGNHANTHGGAIFVAENATLQVLAGSESEHTVFQGNSAGQQGGAIFNGGTTIIGDWTEFVGNSADVAGGAISNNTSPADYETASLQIKDNVLFQDNSSKMGGAIFNQRDVMTIGDDVKFIGNSATSTDPDGTGGNASTGDAGSGGAIMNQADAGNQTKVTIGSNAYFEKNSAARSGGAIANYAWTDIVAHKNNAPTENVVLTIGEGAVFYSNNAVVQGGAIYNDGKLELGKTTFDNNAVTGKTSSSQGGAIYNAGKMSVGADSSFTNNEAWIGGAISNNGSSASLDIGNSVTFENNQAQWAGAIFNQNSALTIADGAHFINNKATGTTPGVTAQDYGDAGMGGAIQNQGTSSSTLTIGKEALFEGNTSEHSYGGAIANYAHTQYGATTESIITTIGAGSSFINNSAALGGGAIFNNGTLNFEGNATFSGNTAGGVLNDIHNEGTVNVKAGTLTLDGGITGDGKLIFADETGLSVKVGTSQEDSTTITNDVTLNGTVNLSMTFAPGYDGTYQVAENVSVTEGAEGFKVTDNAVFNITAVEGENGTFNIEKKSTAEIAESAGVSMNQAAALNAITSEGTATNATYSAIAAQINSMIQSGDTAQMQAAADATSALSPEAAPMVAQVQTDTAAQVFNVIGSRLGSSQGMASGDGTSGTGLWVQGMVGTTDMDDTSTARGYSADTTGLALGLEAKPSDSTKVGMGFAYTNTDVDGFLRSTDVDSYTAFLYGEYKPSNWFVNGIVSYAWANYDEQKSVLGQNIGAKYDADTFGLQVMGGLDLDASGFTVTPEVGLRYYHIGTDAYTDGMGTAVSDSDEDVLTGVIGARLGKTFEVSPSMSFEPQVRLAMTYDIVDADNSSFVTLANGSSYSVEGETLDRFGIEAGVGVKAEMGDNFELSLSYEGAWRGDYQNHAGILNAKYKF